MKIKEVKIKLDSNVFYSGDKVTGNIIVRTHDAAWANSGKVFLKFYGKLDIQWCQDECIRMRRISVGDVKVVYTNLKKPFQINAHIIFDKPSETQKRDDGDYEHAYRFEFETPSKVQGTLSVKNAKSQFFLKAYLTNDENISKHYRNDADVFSDFFKALSHTFCKQEIILLNKPTDLSKIPSTSSLCTSHVYEAKSEHIKVHVTLWKLCFSKNETIDVRCKIEHANENDTHKFEIHKVSFKLFQVAKIVADEPFENSRLFETLVAHSNRKGLHENAEKAIIIEEFIKVPDDVPNTSSPVVTTTTASDGSTDTQLNPIRVNYKLNIEFWRNFLVHELDLSIPISIDPEV